MIKNFEQPDPFFDWFDDTFKRECPFATQIENNFRWAVGHRYTDALLSDCCDTMTSPDMFFDGMSRGACVYELPGSTTVTATSRNSNGGGTVNVDVSGTTDQMWVQVILMGKSDGAVAGAFSSIQAETPGRSKIIASQTLEFEPTLNSGSDAYLILGRPFPALGLSSLMFGVTLYGVGGTITYQPAWRTFEFSQEAPGSWSDLGSSRSATADEDHNFGSLSVSPGAVLYAQVGLKLSSVGRGSAQVQVAAKF